MSRKAKLALAAASTLTLSHAVHAQEPPASPPVAAEGVRIFEPAFFARFNPVTAQDMVRQLPGFGIDNGDSLRGFGATAGNVLINGQRPSTKAIGISEELARIPSRDVLRIELIGASAAGDIDVRGYTELANVVLKPATQTKVSSTYNAMVGLQGQRAGVRLLGGRTWTSQDFSVRLNGQAIFQPNRNETDVTLSNPAGAITGTRDEFSQNVLGELGANLAINWNASPRDTLNLTGRLMGRTFNVNTGSESRNAAGAVTSMVAIDYTEKDILYADLGGDWEHRFSPQAAVKLILVNSLVNWRPQEFFESFAPSGIRTGATRNNQDNRRGEHIARGVFTWKPDPAHSVEMGLEGAFNYRDTVRSIADAGTSGVFVPRILPVASTTVEELRGEAFISDTWRVDPRLTLEMGFTYEASRIEQSGDATREREFTYPKPTFVATWVPDKADQIRLSIERKVAQLDFSEFASATQLLQNTITIGNPDLVPEQTWATSLQWKRTFGQRGSFTLTGYYDDVEDVQDFDFVQIGAQRFTVGGNIGDGERYGARVDLTLPLDDFGVKGGILKIYADAWDSKVTDPVGGFERRFRPGYFDYGWNIDFRQDLPELKLAWGGDYSDLGEGESYRVNEVQEISFGPGDLDLFIETTRWKGLTVRLSADNIGSQPQRITRSLFMPDRFPPGVLTGREFRESANGGVITLSVQGSF